MGNNPENKTDEEIARLVQSGDVEVFGLLVGRYQDKISRYAKKFLSHSQDIEDIVQDVFIKTYKNIKGFDVKKKFSSWIYRIAHNEFVNHLKAKKRRFLFFFDPDTIFPHPVAKEKTDKIKDDELNQMVNVCLDKLEPKYREPLVLYYFEDLAYKEIADILKVPVSTVGVRIRRAKEQLRNYYQDYEDY